MVWLLFAKAAAQWRAIGIAAVVALLLVLVTGGKAYYAIGTVSVCMAAGGVLLDRWLARGHSRVKAASFAVAAVLSSSLIVLLTLPILPLATYAATSLPATVPDTANQVGWPQFVATVEGVVASLPADERARAVILTNDYSEASPLILLGTGLPPVYSGHNSYWSWGPPPDDRTVVIHVGDWRPIALTPTTSPVAAMSRPSTTGVGVENGEQGTAVTLCTGLRQPWSVMWPALRTIS